MHLYYLFLCFLALTFPSSAEIGIGWTQSDFDLRFKEKGTFKKDIVTLPAKEIHPAYQIADHAISQAAKSGVNNEKIDDKTPQEWRELAYQILTYGRFFGGISKTRTANPAERSKGKNVAESLRGFFTEDSLRTDVQKVEEQLRQHQGHLQTLKTFLGFENKEAQFGLVALNVDSTPRVTSQSLLSVIVQGPQGEYVLRNPQTGKLTYKDKVTDIETELKGPEIHILPYPHQELSSDHDPFLTIVLDPVKDIELRTLTWNMWGPGTRGGWGHGTDGKPRETEAESQIRMRQVKETLNTLIIASNPTIMNLQEYPPKDNAAFKEIRDYVLETYPEQWGYRHQKTGADNFNLMSFYQTTIFEELDNNTSIAGLISIYGAIIRAKNNIPGNQGGRLLSLLLKMKNGRRILSVNAHLTYNYPMAPNIVGQMAGLQSFLSDILSTSGMDVIVWTGDNNIDIGLLDIAHENRRYVFGIPNSSLGWQNGASTFNDTDGYAVQFGPPLVDTPPLVVKPLPQELEDILPKEGGFRDYIHALYTFGKAPTIDEIKWLMTFAPDAQIAALNLFILLGKEAWPAIQSIKVEIGANVKKHGDYLNAYYALVSSHNESGPEILELINTGQLTWDRVVTLYQKRPLSIVAALQEEKDQPESKRLILQPSTAPNRALNKNLFGRVRAIQQTKKTQHDQIILLYNNYRITEGNIEYFLTQLANPSSRDNAIQMLTNLAHQLNTLPQGASFAVAGAQPAVMPQPIGGQQVSLASSAYQAAYQTIDNGLKNRVQQLHDSEMIGENVLTDMLGPFIKINRGATQHRLLILMERGIITTAQQVQNLTRINRDKQDLLFEKMVNNRITLGEVIDITAGSIQTHIQNLLDTR